MSGLRARDQGAVATVFALLLAGGVLLGSAALVIDVGQLYVEREELQSGADAAVLAVARACAVDAVPCSTGASAGQLAQRYADDNASDQRAQVLAVCGRFPAWVEQCPAPDDNLTDCLGEPPAEPGRYVEVHLGTEVSSGRFVLPPVFAQAMAGNSGYAGTAVGACARASWIPPAQVSIVALTMSACDYAAATGRGFADPSSVSPSYERSIELVPGHGNCAEDPPGPWLRAGPAAWLAGDGTCQITVAAGGELTGTVDPAAPAGCAARLRQARDGQEVVYIPVHDRVSSGHPERTYRVTHLAPFVVTGWRITTVGNGIDDSEGRCGDPAQRCVAGAFVAGAAALSEVAHGTALVTLIG